MDARPLSRSAPRRWWSDRALPWLLLGPFLVLSLLVFPVFFAAMLAWQGGRAAVARLRPGRGRAVPAP